MVLIADHRARMASPFVGGHDMPLAPIRINGKTLRASRYIDNSPSEETCKHLGIGGAYLDIVHAELEPLGIDIVSLHTYGLIFYSDERPDLAAHPFAAPMVVRLDSEINSKKTETQTFNYEHGKYGAQAPAFVLPGSIGCTASINLGFYLLKTIQKAKSQTVAALFIFDQKRLSQFLRDDPPAADDEILAFCRSQGAELIKTTGRDCDHWPQCTDQPGEKCLPDRARCR